MIDPQHDLPLKKQAEALAISRSSAYYRVVRCQPPICGGCGASTSSI